MSISSYMDCLKNTALKNPIAQAINEALDKLNEISIVGLTESAIATLTAMKDSLLEQASLIVPIKKPPLGGFFLSFN